LGEKGFGKEIGNVLAGIWQMEWQILGLRKVMGCTCDRAMGPGKR
jgi:hypothetical protein